MTLETYIKRKITMLRRDFCVALTETEIEKFHSLTSEIAVDNYARDFLQKL